MSLTVRNLMTDNPTTVLASEPLLTAWTLMREGGFRHLPVVDEDHAIVGVLSDRDVIRQSALVESTQPLTQLREQLRHVSVESAMVSGAETIDADSPITEAAEEMLENKFGCLPVVEGSRVVGILTEADFVRYVASHDR